jgi:hypothetical protein
VDEPTNRCAGGGRGRGVWVCGAVVALAIAVCGQNLPLSSGEPAATGGADELFRLGRWAEARAAYDADTKGLDPGSRRFRESTRGAVKASLQLKDWASALDRAATLIPKSKADPDRESRSTCQPAPMCGACGPTDRPSPSPRSAPMGLSDT